jgi:hypothetical protein
MQSKTKIIDLIKIAIKSLQENSIHDFAGKTIKEMGELGLKANDVFVQ